MERDIREKERGRGTLERWRGELREMKRGRSRSSEWRGKL